MDYDSFKALYEDNNYRKNKVKKDVLDVLDEIGDAGTSLVDELDSNSVVTDFDNSSLVHNVKTPGLDMEPEILVIPPRKDEDELCKTKQIDLISLDEFNSEVMPSVERVYNDEPKCEKMPKKRWFLPWTTDESHHLQNAFVNCSVLGFITMAVGFSQFFYIFTHI